MWGTPACGVHGGQTWRDQRRDLSRGGSPSPGATSPPRRIPADTRASSPRPTHSPSLADVIRGSCGSPGCWERWFQPCPRPLPVGAAVLGRAARTDLPGPTGRAHRSLFLPPRSSPSPRPRRPAQPPRCSSSSSCSSPAASAGCAESAPGAAAPPPPAAPLPGGDGGRRAPSLGQDPGRGARQRAPGTCWRWWAACCPPRGFFRLMRTEKDAAERAGTRPHTRVPPSVGVLPPGKEGIRVQGLSGSGRGRKEAFGY